MKEKSDDLRKIEELIIKTRRILDRMMAKDKHFLNKEEILRVSRKLDELLVAYIRKRENKEDEIKP